MKLQTNIQMRIENSDPDFVAKQFIRTDIHDPEKEREYQNHHFMLLPSEHKWCTELTQ